MEMLRIPRNNAAANRLPAEVPENSPAMEIAHVLFMDVVGFSQLRMQQQAAIQVELQNLVQATPEVQAARRDGKLIVRPTGDGMALLFLRDLLSPVRCALQLSGMIQTQEAQIKQRIGAPIRLRMGVHSGSVLLVEDMNAQSDVAGEGIIIAQRVMDCGDSGHILLSEDVAKKLLNIDPWPRYITDLGEVRVKHGVKVHLYNLYGRLDGPYCGNPNKPKKVQEDSAAQAEELRRYKGTYFQRNPGAQKFLSFALVIAILGGGGWAAWTKVPAVPKFVNESTPKVAAWFKSLGEKKETKEAGGEKAAPGGKTKTASGDKSSTGTGGGGSTRSDSGSANLFGSGEPRVVTVPDVVGRTLSDAKQALRSEGLKLAVTGKAFNSSYGEGLIFRQIPEAGRSVGTGRTIKVAISRGDAPVPEAAPVEDTSGDEAPAPGGDGGGENTGGDTGNTGGGEGGGATASANSEGGAE
jgi:class 3 adenylate cyclase